MIGIDIVDIKRFSRLYSGKNGERFVRRVFSYDEILQCNGKAGIAWLQSLAGRFAAKEAVIKASKGELNISDLQNIIITQGKEGFLDAYVKSKSSKQKNYEISISHDGDYVVAVALQAFQ